MEVLGKDGCFSVVVWLGWVVLGAGVTAQWGLCVARGLPRNGREGYPAACSAVGAADCVEVCVCLRRGLVACCVVLITVGFSPQFSSLGLLG